MFFQTMKVSGCGTAGTTHGPTTKCSLWSVNAHSSTMCRRCRWSYRLHNPCPRIYSFVARAVADGATLVRARVSPAPPCLQRLPPSPLLAL